jgi:phenylpyruvate tautomerase PptA (4-oxalocrotonate tautomerase family)
MMNRNKVIKYIAHSHTRIMSERRQLPLYESITVFIKDVPPENIQVQAVISDIEKTIPSHLLYGIDAIYIGQFQDLIDRSVNAVFDNGAIYITNLQDNNADMLDDIAHEIAHAVETTYGYEIYGDGFLEQEFLGKRSRMKQNLKHHGFDVGEYDFADTEYSKEFDEFLYQEVGYNVLNNLTNHLFSSAYGATSIREYFANGFEHYYLGNPKHVKQTSPVLFGKLHALHSIEY